MDYEYLFILIFIFNFYERIYPLLVGGGGELGPTHFWALKWSALWGCFL